MRNVGFFKLLVGLAPVSVAIIFCQFAAFGENAENSAAASSTPAQGYQQKASGSSAAFLAKEPLEALNMKILWSRKVGPSGKKPVQLVSGTLFFERSALLGASVSLHAVDAQNGDHLWAYPLNASLDFPVTSDSKVIYAIAANVLHIVDINKGISRQKVILPFPPSSPAAPGDRGVWVASWDLNLYFVLSSSGEVARRIPVDGVITASPLVVGPNRVVIADEYGVVRGVAPYDRDKISWQANLRRAVRSDPVKKDGTAYIGSHDYRVHALDVGSGMIIWSALFEGPIERPLWLVGETLLASATSDRMAALDLKERAILWSLKGGLYPVAVSNEVIVVKTERELVAVDMMTGETRWSHPANDIRTFATNNTAPVIYAVPKKGGIVAVSLP